MTLWPLSIQLCRTVVALLLGFLSLKISVLRLLLVAKLSLSPFMKGTRAEDMNLERFLASNSSLLLRLRLAAMSERIAMEARD